MLNFAQIQKLKLFEKNDKTISKNRMKNSNSNQNNFLPPDIQEILNEAKKYENKLKEKKRIASNKSSAPENKEILKRMISKQKIPIQELNNEREIKSKDIKNFTTTGGFIKYEEKCIHRKI